LLPHNFGVADTKRTIAEGSFLNWVNNVMTWELDPDNTNQLWLARGGLGTYLGDSATSIYRCPGDRALSEIQRRAGWTGRVRSISMNAMIGDAGEFSRDGSNLNNPAYRQFFKLTHIPHHAQIFALIEEHPDSINDGYFLNRFADNEWLDLPASHHAATANISFADGHVVARRWIHPSTRPPPKPDAAGLPFPVSPRGTGGLRVADATNDNSVGYENTTTLLTAQSISQIKDSRSIHATSIRPPPRPRDTRGHPRSNSPSSAGSLARTLDGSPAHSSPTPGR
jgi:prepilin-type processing-associated H-X9-DG protein